LAEAERRRDERRRDERSQDEQRQNGERQSEARQARAAIVGSAPCRRTGPRQTRSPGSNAT
jgi:hypothetical protein